MATVKNNKNDFINEELSSQTLELLLFKEMITNVDFTCRLSNVIDLRWFRTPHIRVMAEIAIAYYKKYGGIVTRDLIESVIQRRNETQIIESHKIDLNQAIYDFNKAKDLDLGEGVDSKVRINKIQAYVKQEAMRVALLDSASDFEKSNTDSIIESTLRKFEEIQKILFEEIDFGSELSCQEIDDTLNEHLEYLTNPAARIPTGWGSVDEITHGGFLRDGRSLYVFMAQAGLGKSNILANLGYNFLKQDLKVMVISMEMSQNVYMRRFDSLITKIDIDNLGMSAFTNTLTEKMRQFFKVEHPNAKLLIKEFPPGSISTRTIEQYIDNMLEQRGYKPDVLILDYLNLIKPNIGSSKGESSMYEEGKAVSEELRALSYKYSIPVITAVQCNSSGFDTADINMSNIAQSRGIAHTADFIAGLYQTEDEQLDGIFHMKILKSRLGDKGNLKFDFNKNTLEFNDINNVGIVDNGGTNTSTIDSNRSSFIMQTNPIDDIDKDLFGDALGMP